MNKLKKHLESYNTVTSDAETVDIDLNIESGQILLKFYQDRWRMPKETIKMLKETIILIEDKFL